MRKISGFALGVVLVAVVVMTLGLDYVRRADLILPATTFAGNSLAFVPRTEAAEFVAQRLDTFLHGEITIAARGEVKTTTLEDLGVDIDVQKFVQRLPSGAQISNAAVIGYSLQPKKLEPPLSIDKAQLVRKIHELFPGIPQSQNAYIVNDNGNIRVVEGHAGVVPRVDQLMQDIRAQAENVAHEELFVAFDEHPPTVFASDLLAVQDELLAHIPQSLVLIQGRHRWKLPLHEHLDWIHFAPANYDLVEGMLPFSLTLRDEKLVQFLDGDIRDLLEYDPEDVSLQVNEDWKRSDGSLHRVVITGHGDNGQYIDRVILERRIRRALTLGQEEVEIPTVVVPAQIAIDPQLQKLGIKELITVGHSRFAGSPANRQHNIAVGISKYNGLVIAPGEVFSFNNNLGVVDASTGYRKELVIKNEGTIPEYGGGLCQVSTTLYRAALNGGLEIVDRAPHSYAVTYYSQVGGHGIDATIYPPYRDFKFRNNTNHHVIIQSYVEGVNAYYKFYGTSDGREVVLDGPYIGNHRSAPSQPVLFEDSGLSPGQKEQVQKPVNGFDATWYRTIRYADGTEEKETIFSRYNAVPAKFRVGPETTAEAENQGIVPSFGGI
ncbi:hypothetical protein COV82_06155 [Candidatus Peregrinibacteria bacterium CG11_big_fil_rev_8_21_14_0_20_46_8]|nr:MAG: hypothetical protein COV82_06155 [Candidatus Peregrinibacteria bacterium CG11_big_fil_rev_8_21_14_0_20_46_8]